MKRDDPYPFSSRRPGAMPVEYVDSGTFVVSGERRAKLLAVLGTCVGVALRDREAGVGGIIHLLLPEPPAPLNPWHPERYATTGIPLFIDSLLKKGAALERLEATVAGGALVGPLSELDLSLDIGGRTTEKALSILGKKGIHVDTAETGGYFTSCLSLDLVSWEAEILPPLDLNPTAETVSRPAESEIATSIARLRPIPQIALRITRMIEDEEKGMPDLAREVRKEQVISARVLQLCNSAMMGWRRRINSVDQALVVLGQKRLLRLVISVSAELFFSECPGGYSLCQGGLFHHALGTAITTERLARLTGKGSPAIAYTAGLLHDIGMVVLDQYMADAFPLFYRQIHEDHATLVEAETRHFGITHTETGRLLAENWELPHGIRNAIAFHHQPDASREDTVLPHLVFLADLIVSRFHPRLTLERSDSFPIGDSLTALGLTPEDWASLIDLLPHDLLDITTMLFLPDQGA